MKPRTWAPLALLLAAACSTTDRPAPEGRGVVRADAAPPAGAETAERPTWKDGDRFVFRRGELVRAAFRVERAEDGGFDLVEEQSGIVMHLDADLAQFGQEGPGSVERVTLRPADAQLHWPLWCGKRWAVEFVRVTDQGSLPLLAHYECDAIEEVTVPAGTFRCFRIWRRTRPAVDGDFLDKHDLLWYAPEAGWFARRLENGVLTVLVELER